MRKSKFAREMEEIDKEHRAREKKWKEEGPKRRAENIEEAKKFQSRIEKRRGTSQLKKPMFLPMRYASIHDFENKNPTDKEWDRQIQFDSQEVRHKQARADKKKIARDKMRKSMKKRMRK